MDETSKIGKKCDIMNMAVDLSQNKSTQKRLRWIESSNLKYVKVKSYIIHI